MNSMIKTIRDATEPEQMSKTLKEKYAAAQPYWDKLGKAFSLNWVDEFWSVNTTAWTEEVDAAYERGFLNASQLWLELYTKVSSH